MSDERLKPCPFCGSLALTTVRHAGNRYVECSVCAARGPAGNWNDAVAVSRWNERPGSNAGKERLTFVLWNFHEAIYLGDRLVHYGESMNCNKREELLGALGHPLPSVVWTVPSDLPLDYNREDDVDWWKPDESLKTLEARRDAAFQRSVRDRIAKLEDEIKHLRKEVP